ncbi:nSTAND1 domain-containing NTPase [Pyxidicoccus xibeiensis]|uniref:nSTAND1 domain-containing NTPase n=1 Tax=Pyxidicoccus xibeiensis TaxID=2906759 RepID=UPI0020A71565|nr:hypothetical protein [Pyxidicoccus xibeiensis]MCP3142237.1 hypothetical protein [Pyxidicoccus xibeiensis]
MSAEPLNPFRGPLPYRAEDRARFFCRETVARRLMNSILAHPCVTLFGPSGSGKSSLMQAAVIPELQKEHGFRIVYVDAWLSRESPLHRLARTMYADLDLGDVPADRCSGELVDEALQLAEMRSDRPILIFLDQLEQTLLPERPAELVRELLCSLEAIARKPMRGLQLVLSLREDYLGRLRDLARGHRALLDPGFRLGPLTVKEMANIACKLAAAGHPGQTWSPEEMNPLMRQMRTPGQSSSDDAEVQAAFAQIVCRALWEARGSGAARTNQAPAAEPILHQYLDQTLMALGPSQPHARRLLEEHLVSPSGSRTLLTQAEAHEVLPPGEADQVLNHLQAAAVLRSEFHEGSRYFELGHDWLANKVYELKSERLQLEAQIQRHRQERVQRTRMLQAAVVAGGIVVMISLLWFMAWRAQREATNQSLMMGAQRAIQRGQPAVAMKLLANVKAPGQGADWATLALEALDSNFLEVTLHGPEGQAINTASFDPDGNRIVTASDDGILRMWNANGNEEPTELGRHAAPVTSAEFSRDGKFIVSASQDGEARIWLVDRREQLRVFPHPRGMPVRSATFSPDGKHVVTVAQDGVARRWSVDAPERLPEEMNRPDEVRFNFAAFSADGSRLVTTSWNGTAWLWRAKGGTFEKEDVLPGHEGPVTFAAFKQDGSHLLTASRDGTAWLWRAEGRGQRFQQLKRLEDHDAPVSAGAFSPDGQYLVTASQDGTARVWKQDGSGPPFVLQGHTGPVTSAAFTWHPEHQRLVTASQDGTARVWNADDAKQPLYARLMEHERPVVSAAVDPKGTRIVTASQDGIARVWESEGTRPPEDLEDGHTQALTSAAFSPDGKRIVTTSYDRTAVVWRSGPDGWKPGPVFRHDSPVLSAAFDPMDGQRIVTASSDGIARVWSTEDASRPLEVLKGHERHVTFVAFSPDGRFIATASRDTTVRVWKADGSGPALAVLEQHKGPVSSVDFSPDGQSLVTAAQDGTARVWAWRSAPSEARPLLHEGPVLSARFNGDGSLIVTSSWDGSARVWPVDGRGVPRVLKGHEGPVRSAVFTRDGRIVTASWDKTARVWTLPNLSTPSAGEILAQLQGRNHDCLSPSLRRLYLDESARKAVAGYKECEHDYRRKPSQAVALRKDSLAAGSPSRM